MRGLVATALVLGLVALPSPAGTLYKSIGPNGVIQFSDIPPEKGQVVAQLTFPGQDAAASSDAGAPTQLPAQQYDAALDKANIQLDLAEHALAQARRPVWTEPDVLRISAQRMTRGDRERVAYYEKAVRRARLAVADAMRRKLKAEAAAATVTASNEWVPVPRFSGQ